LAAATLLAALSRTVLLLATATRILLLLARITPAAALLTATLTRVLILLTALARLIRICHELYSLCFPFAGNGTKASMFLRIASGNPRASNRARPEQHR
jgi:hypothetical protein